MKENSRKEREVRDGKRRRRRRKRRRKRMEGGGGGEGNGLVMTEIFIS